MVTVNFYCYNKSIQKVLDKQWRTPELRIAMEEDITGDDFPVECSSYNSCAYLIILRSNFCENKEVDHINIYSSIDKQVTGKPYIHIARDGDDALVEIISNFGEKIGDLVKIKKSIIHELRDKLSKDK